MKSGFVCWEKRLFFLFLRYQDLWNFHLGSWEIWRFGPFFCMWIRPRLMYQKGSNAKGLSGHPTHVVMMRTFHTDVVIFGQVTELLGVLLRDGGNSNIFSEFSSRFFWGNSIQFLTTAHIFHMVGSTQPPTWRVPPPLKMVQLLRNWELFVRYYRKKSDQRSSC